MPDEFQHPVTKIPQQKEISYIWFNTHTLLTFSITYKKWTHQEPSIGKFSLVLMYTESASAIQRTEIQAI